MFYIRYVDIYIYKKRTKKKNNSNKKNKETKPFCMLDLLGIG